MGEDLPALEEPEEGEEDLVGGRGVEGVQEAPGGQALPEEEKAEDP